MTPLVYDKDGDFFYSVNDSPPPAAFHLPLDTNKLSKHVTAYKDKLTNSYYMEIKNINEKFNNLKIECEFFYRKEFDESLSKGKKIIMLYEIEAIRIYLLFLFEGKICKK